VRCLGISHTRDRITFMIIQWPHPRAFRTSRCFDRCTIGSFYSSQEDSIRWVHLVDAFNTKVHCLLSSSIKMQWLSSTSYAVILHIILFFSSGGCRPPVHSQLPLGSRFGLCLHPCLQSTLHTYLGGCRPPVHSRLPLGSRFGLCLHPCLQSTLHIYLRGSESNLFLFILTHIKCSKDVMEQSADEVPSLFSGGELLRQKVSFIVMSVNVRCSPLITC
jgi:hypothetical protein